MKSEEFRIEIERPGHGKFIFTAKNHGKKGFKMTVEANGHEVPNEFYGDNNRELVAMLNAAQETLKEIGHT